MDNSTLTFNRTGTLTLGGNISGTGALTKNNTGTLILGGNNSYNGTTTVNLGELRLTSSTALGNTTDITTTQGTTNRPTLSLDGSGGALSVAETIQLGALKSTDQNTPGVYPLSGGLVNLAGNNTVTGEINNTTGGTFPLIQSAAGKLTLSGILRPGSTVTGSRAIRLGGAGTGEISGSIAERVGWVSGDNEGIGKIGSGEWLISRNLPILHLI